MESKSTITEQSIKNQEDVYFKMLTFKLKQIGVTSDGFKEFYLMMLDRYTKDFISTVSLCSKKYITKIEHDMLLDDIRSRINDIK